MSIGVAMKTFQTEFWKFYRDGSFLYDNVQNVCDLDVSLSQNKSQSRLTPSSVLQLPSCFVVDKHSHSGCAGNSQATQAVIVAKKLKTLSQLVVCSFWRVQSPQFRRNSVVEIPKMFRTWQMAKTDRFFADFSFLVVQVFIAPDSLWTLLWSDLTQLPVELSWVESDRALWIWLYLESFFRYYRLVPIM